MTDGIGNRKLEHDAGDNGGQYGAKIGAFRKTIKKSDHRFKTRFEQRGRGNENVTGGKGMMK